MKTLRSIIVCIFLMSILGCDKNESDDLNNVDVDRYVESELSNSIVLLQVDYMTNVFEGGIEISSSDTIPIYVDYKSPGDFGSIALYYQPSDEMIFNGTIIWMGTGQISYPDNFDSAECFSKLESEIEQPDLTRYQTIYYGLYSEPIEYTNLWNAINKLEIVADYLNGNKKIGLFLYTPSVGEGDPNEWDWFVILNK